MIKVDIKIDKKDLQNFSEKNIKEAMGRSVDDLLVFMEGVAIKVTPVRTGFLKKGFKKDQKGLRANFFNDVKYAPHVNYGTKRQKSNPFMENILNSTEEKIEKIFTHNFNEIL